jgi:2'-5' RNA ligase
MRLFLAIELPEDVRKHLADACGALRNWKLAIVPPQNLHITVKFLGDVSEGATPALCAALRGVAPGGAAELSADRCELLPPRGPVRVVAGGLGGDVGRLRAVHRAIEDACESQGFAPERRQYLPHVTLARAREGLPARERDEFPQILSKFFPGPTFGVTGFTLFESRLGGGPPQYIPLARFGG